MPEHRGARSPIRVAHLATPTFGEVFSGHTRYLFSLLSGWCDDTVSMDLYGTRVKPTNLNSGDREYRLPQGSLWARARRLSRCDRLSWSVRTLALLLVHRHEFDIVHFHSLNWGSLLSPMMLHALGKKAVFTMSLWGDDNPSAIIQQPRGRIQVALLTNFDGAIGLAPALVQDAREHGIRNVICLPNFIAIPELERQIVPRASETARHRLGLPRGGRILLYVGSIIRRKGVDILVDAFVQVSKQHRDVWLVLVGPGSRAETTSIDEAFVALQKEKIRTAGLEDRALWPGLVRDQSLLVEYYRAADIFVFPTRSEGLGNVLIEAMAAGLPVVASLLPGITDSTILDDETGFLVPPDRSDLFSAALDRMLRNEGRRQEMGAAGRKRALETFRFSAYCRELKTFYVDVQGA